MQSLQRFNKLWPQLFGSGHDEAGDEPDGGERNVNEFDKYYGWIYSTKQVAEFEGCKLDEAYQLPLMQALNDLVYLKAKSEHDRLMAKKNGY